MPLYSKHTWIYVLDLFHWLIYFPVLLSYIIFLDTFYFCPMNSAISFEGCFIFFQAHSGPETPSLECTLFQLVGGFVFLLYTAFVFSFCFLFSFSYILEGISHFFNNVFLGATPFHPRRSGSSKEKNGDCRAQEEEGRSLYLFVWVSYWSVTKDLPVQQKKQRWVLGV